MAPTQVREPFHRDGWIYEEKVDGWRILAYKDGHRVHLVSRNGRDHTRRFCVLAAAIANLSARALVLDGEVAIFDEQLRLRFDWLREPDPDAVATPPLLMVFDLLYQDGREFTGRPLRETAGSAGGRRRRQPLRIARAPARSQRVRGVVRSGRARLRGPGRQGRGQSVRGGTDAAMVEGEAEGLDRPRGPLAAAH
jgi:ATP dependent DNA ligase domain